MRRILVSLLVCVCLSGAARSGEVDERLLDAHARFLALPELGEVRAGEPGLAITARYLASELARLGFPGGAPNGEWIEVLPVRFLRPGGACALTWRRGTDGAELAVGREFVAYPFSSEGEAAGEVSFDLGPGSAEGSFEGRILLLGDSLLGRPIRERVAQAARRGAKAVVVVPPAAAATFDEVVYEDGSVRRGRVREKDGKMALVPPGGAGLLVPLERERVREIRYGVPAGPIPPESVRVSEIRPVGIPVVSVGAATAGKLLGRPLVDPGSSDLPTSGRVEGLTIRISVSHRVETLEVPVVRARLEGATSTPPVLVAAGIGRDEGAGESAAIALAVAAALADGDRPLRPVEFELGGRPPSEGDQAVKVRIVAGDLEVRAEARRVLSAIRERAGAGITAEGALLAARGARLRGEAGAATRILDSALERSPGAVELILERGRARLAAGDWAAALEDAANLTRLDIEEPRAQLLRAEVWYAEGREAEAWAALDLAAAAGLPEALYRRAIERSDQPEMADAVRADLRAAFERAGETALGFLARGVLALALGHAEVAEEMLTKALGMDPALRDAYRYRGEVRALLERNLEGSLSDCDAARRLGVEDPALLFTRGLCLLKLRMYTLAIEDFVAYADAGGEDTASSVYNIACAHSLVGNREEALEWLGRAVEAGFSDLGHARLDPDLASIREDPRFRKILRSSSSD